MKSTGVVRRIDDLGRIVIPKEIRRNLKIRDGENMEIFIDLDSIILKKYSKLEDALTLSDKFAKIVYEVTGYNILITDREKIITSYGIEFENLKNQVLSEELINVIDTRTNIKKDEKAIISITNEIKKEGYFYGLPIISTADSIGLILFLAEEPLSESVKVIGQLLSLLICEQVDIS